MSRLKVLCAAACLTFAAGSSGIHASGGNQRTLVVTMTNDPTANEIRVYDADSHVLLQTLSAHGQGGVGGNARGIRQHDGRLITTGAPADIDADAGVLGVIDHGTGESHLSVFSYNQFGELSPAGTIITVGVPDANGIAILSPRADERN